MVCPFSKRSTAVQDRNALFTSMWNIILSVILNVFIFQLKSLLNYYDYIDIYYIILYGIIVGRKNNNMIYDYI